MGLAMMIAGIGLSQGTHAGALAATVMIFLFNTFFAIGWLGTTWLYPVSRRYKFSEPVFQICSYMMGCRPGRHFNSIYRLVAVQVLSPISHETLLIVPSLSG
jgi:uncharacterized membrane protein YgaE (UPF0421/DUF939 family)